MVDAMRLLYLVAAGSVCRTQLSLLALLWLPVQQTAVTVILSAIIWSLTDDIC